MSWYFFFFILFIFSKGVLVLCSVYYHQSDQGEEKCWLRSNQTTRWEQHNPPLAFFHWRKNKNKHTAWACYNLNAWLEIWLNCLLHFCILLRLKHSTISEEVSYYTDEAELSQINLCIFHNSRAYKLVRICLLCCGLQTAATRSIFEASGWKEWLYSAGFNMKYFFIGKKQFTMTAVGKQLKKTNQIFLYYLLHPEHVIEFWDNVMSYVLKWVNHDSRLNPHPATTMCKGFYLLNRFSTKIYLALKMDLSIILTGAD